MQIISLFLLYQEGSIFERNLRRLHSPRRLNRDYVFDITVLYERIPQLALWQLKYPGVRWLRQPPARWGQPEKALLAASRRARGEIIILTGADILLHLPDLYLLANRCRYQGHAFLHFSRYLPAEKNRQGLAWLLLREQMRLLAYLLAPAELFGLRLLAVRRDYLQKVWASSGWRQKRRLLYSPFYFRSANIYLNYFWLARLAADPWQQSAGRGLSRIFLKKEGPFLFYRLAGSFFSFIMAEQLSLPALKSMWFTPPFVHAGFLLLLVLLLSGMIAVFNQLFWVYLLFSLALASAFLFQPAYSTGRRLPLVWLLRLSVFFFV